MIVVLLIIGAVLYALGRGTTEAVTFEWKNKNSGRVTIGEYHWWGLIEALGIVLFASYCFADGFTYTESFSSLFVRQLLNVIAFYCIYYPVYTLWFNAYRKQTDYYYNHYKLLGWEIPYPPVWLVAIIGIGMVIFL